MLLESSYGYIHFTDIAWPEFGIYDLLHAILMYQIHRPNLPQNEEKRTEGDIQTLQKVKSDAEKKLRLWTATCPLIGEYELKPFVEGRIKRLIKGLIWS